MHEKRYIAEIERLRLPQRIALLEIERVADLALDGIEVQNVLDIGTGSGIFAEAFSKIGLAVTGIDPNPDMLQAAQAFAPDAIFQQGTVEEIPFAPRSFDLVFLGHVLHESDDIIKALAESKRCAKHRVIVLEWPYRQEQDGPPLEHRLKTEDILSAARTIGFSRIETIPLHHMVLFRFTI
ncbi:MAG: class I SAM-dependent methyltransferase [Ignavibacteriae bacterium]|nr:MAG: class I SAM-dependent methyltransferase [Ignavibacteriota bacterium]